MRRPNFDISQARGIRRHLQSSFTKCLNSQCRCLDVCRNRQAQQQLRGCFPMAIFSGENMTFLPKKIIYPKTYIFRRKISLFWPTNSFLTPKVPWELPHWTSRGSAQLTHIQSAWRADKIQSAGHPNVDGCPLGTLYLEVGVGVQTRPPDPSGPPDPIGTSRSRSNSQIPLFPRVGFVMFSKSNI
jgi:hypothetical protein